MTVLNLGPNELVELWWEHYCESYGVCSLIKLIAFIYWFDGMSKHEEFIPGVTWVIANVLL